LKNKINQIPHGLLNKQKTSATTDTLCLKAEALQGQQSMHGYNKYIVPQRRSRDRNKKKILKKKVIAGSSMNNNKNKTETAAS
jgi:hypothetical protein